MVQMLNLKYSGLRSVLRLYYFPPINSSKLLRKLPWSDTSPCYHSRASLASEIKYVLSGNKVSA